jgi:hypothetical protein
MEKEFKLNDEQRKELTKLLKIKADTIFLMMIFSIMNELKEV